MPNMAAFHVNRELMVGLGSFGPSPRFMLRHWSSLQKTGHSVKHVSQLGQINAGAENSLPLKYLGHFVEEMDKFVTYIRDEINNTNNFKFHACVMIGQ